MKISFEGRRAIVTGANHGFGRAIAKAFAENGAEVFALDVRSDGFAETKAACGGRCETHVVDVTDRDTVQRFVGDITKDRAVDILVNNAGGVLGQVHHPMEEISAADWQKIFDVNVTGAFNCAQAVVPGMKRAKSGRIVNISSGAGLGFSLTGIQAYASAKAAQIGLTRQLAHELGPWNITVNNVAPGFVRSNPTTEKQWDSYGAEGQKRLVDSIALKRLGAPSDIANAVLFFASDLAGWVSGQVLSVDGGK
jgi:3-oxoacyl-[acyl-carrier protein] reductase